MDIEGVPMPAVVASGAQQVSTASVLPVPPAPPSAERILEVLAKAGALFFRWDAFSGLTFLSGNTQELLGYSREELLGDSSLVRRVVDPEFIPLLERRGADFFVVRAQALRVEVPFVARGGRRVWIEARVVPELDEGGHIVGFLGIALNADEARRTPATPHGGGPHALA
jgi:PAS domain S-box-containing protein